ncbi:MAG: helix-turn-helix transcriptional regulator [Epulopiscium sp.]|jgi:transcriptional regulator with XRE-family HTH domain|nr:helix-turn-helix transcriptional regulator [Candidatus Epulonipiscium sp.]
MEFKDRLRSLRKEKKYTQVKLGEMLNYGYTAIANYESGRNQPSIPDLIKIAKIFNVSMDYLLGINDIRLPYTDENDSPEFHEFKKLYSSLSPQGVEELLLFMRWLISKEKASTAVTYQSPDDEESNVLRVAEPDNLYSSKKRKS